MPLSGLLLASRVLVMVAVSFPSPFICDVGGFAKDLVRFLVSQNFEAPPRCFVSMTLEPIYTELFPQC
jgi:hypothetical protein